MARRFSDSRLVIASHNAGKLREIAALMTPFGVTCLSAVELGLAEPEETGKTFAENAALKAHLSAEASASPALAERVGRAASGHTQRELLELLEREALQKGCAHIHGFQRPSHFRRL